MSLRFIGGIAGVGMAHMKASYIDSLERGKPLQLDESSLATHTRIAASVLGGQPHEDCKFTRGIMPKAANDIADSPEVILPGMRLVTPGVDAGRLDQLVESADAMLKPGVLPPYREYMPQLAQRRNDDLPAVSEEGIFTPDHSAGIVVANQGSSLYNPTEAHNLGLHAFFINAGDFSSMGERLSAVTGVTVESFLLASAAIHAASIRHLPVPAGQDSLAVHQIAA